MAEHERAIIPWPKRILAIVMAAAVLIIFGCSAAIPVAAYQFGSNGDMVKEIQQRLKDWGYYFGSVDGNYGKATEDAVIAFQIKHGIRIDGIVGAQTAEKLGVSLAGADGGGGSSATSGDVYLLAQLVYGESRGEPYTGKVAVAACVLNRVESSLFPNSIAKVIYQPGAFSVVDDGQINLAPDQDALRAARDAMNGWDPSGGALFYYNPKKTSNKYMLAKPIICTIGDHVFCK